MVNNHQRHWAAIFQELDVEPTEVEAVIFPELLRQEIVRDSFEQLGLWMLYVNVGKGAVDFSVGVFLRRSSFVEQLETAVANQPDLPSDCLKIIEFPAAKNERDKRLTRYKRLLDQDWQIHYLSCFWLITTRRLGLDSLEPGARVSWLAASYNRGFWLPKDEIEKYRTACLFPDGKLALGRRQYSYADIAVAFYVAKNAL